MLARRSFLFGAAALVAAPAVIRTPGLLMPVKSIIDPTEGLSFADMVTETLRRHPVLLENTIMRNNVFLRLSAIPALEGQAEHF